MIIRCEIDSDEQLVQNKYGNKLFSILFLQKVLLYTILLKAKFKQIFNAVAIDDFIEIYKNTYLCTIVTYSKIHTN